MYSEELEELEIARRIICKLKSTATPNPDNSQKGLEFKFTRDQYGREICTVVESDERRQEKFQKMISEAGLQKYLEVDWEQISYVDRKDPAQIFRWIRDKNSGCFFYGPPGVGKTLLSVGIAKQAFDAKTKIYITRWDVLLQKLRSAYRKDSEQSVEDILYPAKTAELLVLDEVGEEGKQKTSGFEEECLYSLFSSRYGSNAPWIVTSNFSPVQLVGFYGKATVERMTSKECIRTVNFSNEKNYRK